MNLHQLFLKKNDCYKAGRTIIPKGIMVHSTGANNPNLRRYVGPDDGLLGRNTGGNHWNTATPGGSQVCVHAFIGKLKDGTIATYQWEQVDANNRLQLANADQGQVAVSGFEGGKFYLLRLTVTDNEGAVASGLVRIYTETPSDVAEPVSDRLSVYPNPFAERLCVDLPREWRGCVVKLYSATGMLMMRQPVAGNSSLVLDTSRLPRGYYVLVCEAANGQRHSQVVLK